MQSIMQVGQTYNISAWVRIASGTNQNVQLTLKKTDAGGDQYAPVGSASVSSSAWVQLSGSYTLSISGTLSGLTLYCEVPSSATIDYYIDDLSVTASSSGAPGTNGVGTVTWTDVRQRIDGFGASSAWRGNWTTAVADMFFSTNSGLGLSFLRTRIAPGGTTVENTIMQMARDRGARVWSAPWTPTTNYKGPNAGGVVSLNGGPFIGTTANYQSYASVLAGYVVNMKNTYGVNLYALSVQNEPDFDTTNYEACVWTPQQIHDFVPYLSAALAASNVANTKIIIPESDIWSGDTALYTTTMKDPSVAPLVSVIANHNYVNNNNVGDQSVPVALPNYGKSLWETEVSTFNAFESSINNGMYWAGRIHAFLTVAQLNAWHYWWLSASGGDNSGLASSGDLLAKRGYVLGNFSRFVRPDWYRIGVVTNSGTALVSAYKDPISSRFAIVAINQGNNVVTQTVNLAGFTGVTTLTPWVTSAAFSLASQSSLAVSGGSFTYQLPATSVVTFVGQVANTAPTLTSTGDRTVPTGVTLSITNSASDPDSPPQSLTYSIVQGPTNAAIDPTNGIFIWRPSVSQGNSTNIFAIRAADNGSPSLSGTNSFKVTVPAVNHPALSSISENAGRTTLAISGDAGPDYIVQTSTNLLNWVPLLTTNPAALPLTVSVTNGPDAQRFYRIQLGP